MTTSKQGRPRVGQPISVALTDAQRAWLDAQVKPGETRAAVLRELIRRAMAADG